MATAASPAPRVQHPSWERRFIIIGAALLLCALGAQFPASRLAGESRLEHSLFVPGGEAERRELARLSYGMYLPHKRWLHIASLGNSSLAADAVWIKSAGYVTREFTAAYRDKKFEWLQKLYWTVFDLDPQWTKSAHVGAMILGAVRQDPESAVRLLARSMMANPDSWYLAYQAGVTCLLWPGHSADAVKYFREAIRRPGHPPILERVIPRLMSEAGRLDEAVRHARARALSGGMKALSVGTAGQLAEFAAKQLERDLQRAVNSFKEARGQYPATLSEMRSAGPFLVQYDVHFGEEGVLFDKEHAGIAQLYAQSSGGAPVPNIAQLAASGFINALVLAGRLPPPELTDAYGLPYRYHAPTGTVRSPGRGIFEVIRTTSTLNEVAVYFNSRMRRRPESLEELATWSKARIDAGKTFQQHWSLALGDGRPPEHPFATWGERYEYDPILGTVTLPDQYAEAPVARKVQELRDR